MSTELPVEALQAITGLETGPAARLLEAANGDLTAAIDLHFASVAEQPSSLQATPGSTPRRTPSLSSTTRFRGPQAPSNPPPQIVTQSRPWERYMAGLARYLSSLATSTLTELLHFLKGIFVPHNPIADVSFTSRFRSLFPSDHPAQSLSFANPPFSNALSTAINSGRPLLVIGVDFAALNNHRDVAAKERLLELLRSQEVVTRLQQETTLYGFSLTTSLPARLTARVLGLQAPVSITALLPVRLSPAVAEQYRLILRGRRAPAQLNHSETFPGLGGPDQGVRWSSDVQERLVESVQTISMDMTVEATALGNAYGIELLRGGLICCCKIPLADIRDTNTLMTIITLALRLTDPINQQVTQTEQRRQEDRELIARQQEEYEDSLRADRRRVQERAEKAEAEAAVAKAEEEATKAKEAAAALEAQKAIAFAAKLLSATCAFPGAAESDFAEISLRIAPANERVRVRVHRELTIAALQKTLCVLDELLRTDQGAALKISKAVEPDVPSCVEVLKGSAGAKKILKRLIPNDKAFQLISVGAGPLTGENTIEGSGLLPNAVVHLRPTCL